MRTVYLLMLLSAMTAGFSSCTDKYTEELNINVPVYMSYDDFRSAIAGAPARALVHPGIRRYPDRRLSVLGRRRRILPL
ncbi:MAG: hypothetical protein LBT83_10315 [Tannerella sp.]|nr:hypothetical protein [Tannerella sp.]